MHNILFLGLLGLMAFIIIEIIWRAWSRHESRPCPTWLGWLVELPNPFANANRSSTVIDLLELQPGMQVLDAGCGPGRLTLPIAQKIGPTGTITAVDMQRGMLQKVKDRARFMRLQNIIYLQAGLGEGKLDKDKYDRALLVTVLGEIPKKLREAAMKELFDALKPQGILSVTETIFDPHYQSKKTIRRLATEVGFRERKMIGNWLTFTIHFEKP